MNTKSPLPQARVLIVMLSTGWMATPRLPGALSKAGFKVASFCQANEHLTKTRFSERTFIVPAAGNIFPALIDAIREWAPELLIPGCEQSVQFFHEIVNANQTGLLPSGIDDVLSLLRRSLGTPQHYQATLSKHKNQEIAARLGLRTPRQSFISGIDHALQVAEEYEFPLVLKGEFGIAGSSVRICKTKDEIPDAFNSLTFRNKNQTVVIQQFIEGSLAMRAGVAVSGKLLESLVAEKFRTYPLPTSPCSVARFIENDETEHTLSVLVREYEFSGFCSADFCIESGTRHAYLLELNPRPTALCALGHLYGHDLCRALFCHLSGVPYERTPATSEHKMVAFFPNELHRDRQSVYLTQAHHDVPWDDHDLLMALLQNTSS